VAECSQKASQWINVPISPGLHADVGIKAVHKIDLEERVEFKGPGIIAFDGDRVVKLADGEVASAMISRDGPRIIEAERVMATAAEQDLFEKA
jgi:hypothetical protein